jgi:hypothetical protein
MILIKMLTLVNGEERQRSLKIYKIRDKNGR